MCITSIQRGRHPDISCSQLYEYTGRTLVLTGNMLTVMQRMNQIYKIRERVS